MDNLITDDISSTRGTETILEWEEVDFDWSMEPGAPRSARAETTATALGMFAVAIGLAELIAPHPLSRLIGVRDRRWSSLLLRAFGLRELATGLGILGVRRRGPWLWARVAGDAVDLFMLGLAMRDGRSGRARTATALAAVAGVTALDVYAAAKSDGVTTDRFQGPVRKSITVAVTPDRAYRFWRDLENLPSFMQRVDAVEPMPDGRSKWRARGPAGKRIEWEAEIVEDLPNELIRWRSAEGSPISHRGEVGFRAAPGNRGTEISVTLEYVAPGGDIGRLLAFTSTEALKVQVGRDLRHLKQLMEVGEVVHSDASVHRGRHPARPGQLSRI